MLKVVSNKFYWRFSKYKKTARKIFSNERTHFEIRNCFLEIQNRLPETSWVELSTAFEITQQLPNPKQVRVKSLSRKFCNFTQHLPNPVMLHFNLSM